MPNYRRVKIAGGTYFFTLVTNQRNNIFLLDKTVDLFLEALNHVKNLHPFNLVAYCILPDHIHLLWDLPDGDDNFSLRISEIKKRFSKHFIAEYGNQNSISTTQRKRGETGIWQRRFWEHYIRDEEDLNRHIDYIHYNPVKHGLVNRAYDWHSSSFSEYIMKGYYGDDWGVVENSEKDFHTFGE